MAAQQMADGSKGGSCARTGARESTWQQLGGSCLSQGLFAGSLMIGSSSPKSFIVSQGVRGTVVMF